VILSALRSAALFLGLAWRRAWLAMLLTGAAAEQWLARRSGADAGLWLCMTALAAVVACGALWRLGLARAGTGPGGLQAGRVEFRLIAVTLLSVLFMMILGTLALFVLIAFAYAAASAGRGFVSSDIATWAAAVDGRGRVVVTVVAAVCGLALAWASARISMAAPATITRNRVQVLATWPITRGQAWRIMLANLILIALPALLIVAVLRSAADPGFLARSAAALIMTGLWLPLSIGLMTYFYRRLEPAAGDSPST
jgi:hypothetical protein